MNSKDTKKPQPMTKEEIRAALMPNTEVIAQAKQIVLWGYRKGLVKYPRTVVAEAILADAIAMEPPR